MAVATDDVIILATRRCTTSEAAAKLVEVMWEQNVLRTAKDSNNRLNVDLEVGKGLGVPPARTLAMVAFLHTSQAVRKGGPWGLDHVAMGLAYAS